MEQERGTERSSLRESRAASDLRAERWAARAERRAERRAARAERRSERTEREADAPASAPAAAPAHERWIDVLRAIACVGVVFLHVSSGFPEGNVVPFIGATRAFAWTAGRIIVGRAAVPCFFMITGYLLLDDKRPFTAATLGRHMARIAALLVLFGLPMNIAEQIVENTPILDIIPRSIILLMGGRSWGAMWYLYALLFVYLLIPVMRVFLDRLSRKESLYVLGALFVVGCVAWPIFSMAGNGAEVPLIDFPPAPFYAFLGGWLHRHRPERDALAGPILIAAGLALALLLGIEAHFITTNGWINYWIESYANPLIAVYALAVFETVRFDLPQPSTEGAIGRAITLLSRDSLGIYLTHTVFFNLLYKFLHLSPLYTPPGTYVLFWVAGVAFGVAATEALRRVPVYREFL